MLEWCSMAERMISSPGLRVDRPQVAATRLMPSVVPRVKMISRASAALMNFAHGSPGVFVGVGRRWLRS